MKKLLLICLLATAPLAWSQTKAPASPAAPAAGALSVSGEVLDVKDVGMYTYLLLKTPKGDTWAAVPTAKVKKGDKVSVVNAMVMNNFESKSLKKTFDAVVFGTLSTGGAPAGAAAPAAGPHAVPAKPAEVADVKVPRATGANARTVAEVLTKPADLKDKPVLIRGKVVKFNGGIMGKNWVHLRDGTGAAAANTNDVLVTTKEEVKVGDVVTVKGVVRTDKDFGSGYTYKVVVEEATLQK
jgi:hypothetical protein